MLYKSKIKGVNLISDFKHSDGYCENSKIYVEFDIDGNKSIQRYETNKFGIYTLRMFAIYTILMVEDSNVKQFIRKTWNFEQRSHIIEKIKNLDSDSDRQKLISHLMLCKVMYSGCKKLFTKLVRQFIMNFSKNLLIPISLK
jgi:hypothetical protein